MFICEVVALNKTKNASYKKDSILWCDTKRLLDIYEHLKGSVTKDYYDSPTDSVASVCNEYQLICRHTPQNLFSMTYVSRRGVHMDNFR
jgi:hypothetical protein